MITFWIVMTVIILGTVALAAGGLIAPQFVWAAELVLWMIGGTFAMKKASERE